jgi:hypothetical protein
MLSKAEKLQVFNQDRSIGSSYADHTALINPSAGGRFAREATTTVVKSGQEYPAQPPNSYWHHDPVPREEPYGVDVNAMEPIGGPPETVAARDVETSSLARSSAYATQVEPTFRRRK